MEGPRETCEAPVAIHIQGGGSDINYNRIILYIQILPRLRRLLGVQKKHKTYVEI